MITVSNVAFQFGGQLLFKDVDLKFTPGNCYGIIGANGAGKSTFLRILCGELQPTRGEVSIPKEVRMSVLKQDHFAYEEYTVLDTVIMGNKRLYDIMKEKDALYSKEDFSDEDGIRASELEGEFAELNGWEAESDASKLIQGLGLSDQMLYSEMSSLKESEKVKVLLAQALFGNPDIILLDEPTTFLDIQHSIEIMEILNELKKDGKGIIAVVHYVRAAFKYADRILILKDGKLILDSSADTAYESSELTDALGITLKKVFIDGETEYFPVNIKKKRAASPISRPD